MKVNSFDRATVRALRDELNLVLNKYGTASNLEFKIGNMRFSTSDVTIKMVAKVQGKQSSDEAKNERELIGAMNTYGLNKVSADGTKTLIGYKSRRFKYPFVYQDKKGKTWKTSTASARIHFGKAR
jgi:hypothetical protein